MAGAGDNAIAMLGEALLSIGCSWILVAVCSMALGEAVFGPLQAASRFPPPPSRFSLSELVVLIVQLQIAAGFIFAVTAPRSDVDGVMQRLSSTLFMGGLLATWWWQGIRMLSRAGIDRYRHRLWFLGLLTPLGFIVALSILFLPICVFAAVLLVATAYQQGEWGPLRYLIVVVILAALEVAAIFVCRSACQCIVRQRDQQDRAAVVARQEKERHNVGY